MASPRKTVEAYPEQFLALMRLAVKCSPIIVKCETPDKCLRFRGLVYGFRTCMLQLYPPKRGGVATNVWTKLTTKRVGKDKANLELSFAGQPASLIQMVVNLPPYTDTFDSRS